MDLSISYDEKEYKRLYDGEKSIYSLTSSEELEICMIVSGAGIHRVMNQDIPCKSGDIFVTPENTPHAYFVSEEGESLFVRRIVFSPSELELLGGRSYPSEKKKNYCFGIFNENPAIACAMLNDSMQVTVGALCDSIKNELELKGNNYICATRSYLSLLLINVGRYINCSIKNMSFDSSKEWNTVLTLIKIVKESYQDPELTLESVAARLYVSKSNLSKIFNKLTGEHFSEYVKKLRLSKACKLLKESHMTVEAIVKECGLRDVSSFYKSFGEHMNMTPNEYRQSVSLSDNDSEKYKKSTKEEKNMSILNDISTYLQQGKSKMVKELVQSALDEGVKAEEILNEALLAGMGIVGEKFKNNEVYVPEVLVAARAMNMGVQVLKPYLLEAGVEASGKVCIGTVQGDLHDIGKNLVKMMMEGKGLEVIDLGTDVPAETFVKTAIEEGCQVICCSALLTTTMNVMADVVKEAEAKGVRGKIKIMVGGAPVSQEYADQIGADCYTVDAASAADAAVAFCKA